MALLSSLHHVELEEWKEAGLCLQMYIIQNSPWWYGQWWWCCYFFMVTARNRMPSNKHIPLVTDVFCAIFFFQTLDPFFMFLWFVKGMVYHCFRQAWFEGSTMTLVQVKMPFWHQLYHSFLNFIFFETYFLWPITTKLPWSHSYIRTDYCIALTTSTALLVLDLRWKNEHWRLVAALMVKQHELIRFQCRSK